jgi:hypothetical protein
MKVKKGKKVKKVKKVSFCRIMTASGFGAFVGAIAWEGFKVMAQAIRA